MVGEKEEVDGLEKREHRKGRGREVGVNLQNYL